MLADDITGIAVDGGEAPIVFPAMPRSKLWADAADKLGHNLQDLAPLRPAAIKFSLSARQQFARQPLPLSKVFLLHPADKEKLSIEQLAKMAGFQVLLDHTYREQFLSGLQTRDVHLQLAVAAASRSTIYRVTRPARSYQLQELADLIEDSFLDENE